MRFFKSSKLFGKHSSYNSKRIKAMAQTNKKLKGYGKQILNPFSKAAKRLSYRARGIPNPGLATIQHLDGRIIVTR